MASPAPVYIGQLLRSIDRSADELCDDLLIHTLDCDRCLNPEDFACSTFQTLQGQIIAQGGAQKAALYAI